MATACSQCSATSTMTCTTCRASLCAEHAHMGQPFISVGQLLTTTASTAVRAPGALGNLLFKELDSVPYCADCRAALASKRTTEQLKMLIMMLTVLFVVGFALFYLVLG